MNLIQDIIVLTLPMPILWRLQMATKKKMALSGIFGIGIAYGSKSLNYSIDHQLTRTPMQNLRRNRLPRPSNKHHQQPTQPTHTKSLLTHRPPSLPGNPPRHHKRMPTPDETPSPKTPRRLPEARHRDRYLRQHPHLDAHQSHGPRLVQEAHFEQICFVDGYVVVRGAVGGEMQSRTFDGIESGSCTWDPGGDDTRA